jgi:Bacterial PH domain/Short C-terminal domain
VPYVDGLLATDERIVRRERQHWLWPVLQARYAVLALVAALVAFVLAWWLPSGGFTGSLAGLCGWLALIGFVIGVVWLGWAVLRWQNQEYVITTRRVIQAGGVLNKEASDSSLDKINDARISVPMVGRILGYGDLEVMTASESGIERFRLLPDPVAFKRAMLDAKQDAEYDLARPRMPAPPIRSDGTSMPPLQRTDGEAPPVAPPVAAAPVIAAPAPPVAAAPAPSVDVGPERGTGASSDEVTRTLGALADLRDRGAITPEEYEAKKRELLARL